MATYNLSSNQAHRINFDADQGMYFDDQIESYIAAGGNVDSIDRNTFDAWFAADLIDTDDAEEAKARALLVFEKRLAYAKANR